MKYIVIAMIIILLVSGMAYTTHTFEKGFEADVTQALKLSPANNNILVTEQDLNHLPAPVRRYLVHAGVVGKPHVRNFYIEFHGEMRNKGKDWFTFRSRQYNIIEPGTRLFFMKANMFGMKVPGYHKYQYGKASMNIKLFGLIPLVSHHEDEMFRTESVTFLNDVCLFAPAALVGKQFEWEDTGSTSARVFYTNGNTKVSAVLLFNAADELVNFISDDRMALPDMKTYRFSTPAGNYSNLGGHIVPTYGETVWHYPDGLFTYGKFRLKALKYNVTE